MIGRFRECHKTIWCPKPKVKTVYDVKDGGATITDTQKQCKVTAWQRATNCELCPFLEEIHDDNDGVFCLYGLETKEAEK